MYPGEFKNQLTVDEQGIYHFNSWDGETRDDGLFGYWNSPDDFSNFVYVWIVPKHFEIVSYKSNREGKWVTRDNSITFFATASNNLTFEVSYRLLDGDMDGISDNKDYCPQTAANTEVNEYGCAADNDHDGIVDSLDQCPNTTTNLSVDARGCENDSDKDGIVDSLDHCLDTATDLTVDVIGCEIDSDKDGVVDSVDQCPTTAPEIIVDATGCEIDSDKDGVINEKDLCPDTVANNPVDNTGCNLAAPVNLKGVNFKTASDELLAESAVILDNVADVLAVHTNLFIEISGHTDNTGNAESNAALSQRRAESVRNYLIEKGVSAESLSAKGYGDAQPLANNTTAAGRKINRRVELKRLN